LSCLNYKGRPKYLSRAWRWRQSTLWLAQTSFSFPQRGIHTSSYYELLVFD